MQNVSALCASDENAFVHIKRDLPILSITIIMVSFNVLLCLGLLIQDVFPWLRDDSRKFYLIVFLHKVRALTLRTAQKA